MKLVRDYIPEIIMKSGRECEYFRIESKDQHMAFLKEKMIEELNEFMADPCEEEAADMLEVFLSMLKIKDIDLEEVEDYAFTKRLERGGFGDGFVLVRY